MTILEIALCLLSLGLSATSGYYVYWGLGPSFLWIPFLLVPVFYVALLYVWIFFVFLWGLFFDKKKKVEHFDPFYYSILQSTDRAFVKASRVRWRFFGYQNVPKEGRFVLVSNHLSNWDQMVLIAALKKKEQPLACITKPENMNFPIAGPFIHHSGFIPIDREHPEKGREAIEKGVRYLKNGESNICICPEGTRNKTEAPLLPFHPGSFKLASWANVPIVVVCLKGTKEIHKRVPFRSARVDIDILETIYPDKYEKMTSQELATYCENLIKNDLENQL